MKPGASRKVFIALNAIFTVVICLLIIIPLWMVIVTSLSPDAVAAEKGFVLAPQGFSLTSYQRIFKSHGYMNSFKNSVFVTVTATALSLVLTTTMAYALAQKELVFQKFFMYAVLITMFLDGGMVPYYMVVRNLGMINSFSAIIIPVAVGSYNLILMRNYFRNIPDSLVESGRLDGCSELGVLVRIVLPVSVPIIAAVTLFYTVSHWNRYFDVVLFMNSSNKYTLQVMLRQLIFEDVSDAGVMIQYNNFKMAVMLLAMLPVLVLYPFIQRYFITGIMLGSVKE